MEAQAQPDSVLIATIEKSKKEELRISIDTFHGRKLLNMRVFYKDDDGTMKPGKQGVAIAVDLYKDFAGAILEAGRYLKSKELL